MTQTYNANDVLMGASGPPAWKFEDPNTVPREGIITSPPVAKQEREYVKDNPGGGAFKVFPSGDPIMGVNVEVQTSERKDVEDDGKRTFFIEGRYLKEAVRNAVRAAGAPGLEVGGKLLVTFTHREDPMDKRSRKFWDIQYVPAGNSALMGEQPPAAAQAAPPAYTTPVQQQAAPVAYQQPPAAPAQAAPVAAQAAPPAMTAEQMAAFASWQASQGQQG